MNYRTAMLAAAACAAAISLAACTVTTTASPASAGSTVSVSGPIGRFPLPPGAQLINDGTDNGHYDIVFGSVSPSEASRFYTTALPRAGVHDHQQFLGGRGFLQRHRDLVHRPWIQRPDRGAVQLPHLRHQFRREHRRDHAHPAVRPRPEAAGKGNPAGQDGLRQLPDAAALPGIRPDHPPGIRDLGRLGRERTTAAAPAMARAAAPSWPREAPARDLEGSAAKAGSNVEIGQCRASRAHA